MFFINNLVVFFGGKSPEREISVITGLLTLNSVNGERFNVLPVYVNGDGIFYSGELLKNISFYKSPEFSKLYKVVFLPGERKIILAKKRKRIIVDVYCAINCMHGRGGEDGSLVGLLRLCSIPFVSPDMYASALAIDKDFTKITLAAMQIESAPYLRVKRQSFFERNEAYIKFIERKIGFPLIIKPARLGSSIGIKKVDDKTQLFEGLCEAFNYDDKVICEKYLVGSRDLNCAVYSLGEQIFVSEIEEAAKKEDILSFTDKYGGVEKAVGNERMRPTDLTKEQIDLIKTTSKRLYRELDFTSIIRFDFLLSEGKVYLNEINAVPGSMAYYFFCDKISEFSELIDKLVEDAISRKRMEDNYKTFYNSDLLYRSYSGIKK